MKTKTIHFLYYSLLFLYYEIAILYGKEARPDLTETIALGVFLFFLLLFTGQWANICYQEHVKD